MECGACCSSVLWRMTGWFVLVSVQSVLGGNHLLMSRFGWLYCGVWGVLFSMYIVSGDVRVVVVW